MKIDAHQHFWRLGRGDYGWLTPALAPIFRDFMPDDLAPLLATRGLDRTILVQAAPTSAETRFLLDIAERTPFVAGVVGWVDFEAQDAPSKIESLGRNRLLVGLRPMIHDLPDPDWLSRADLVPAFNAMSAEGLVFDALVRPPHLTRLLEFAERHPDLSIVVDHCAKPDIAARDFGAWRADIAALGSRANVSCKLSGLVTEAAAAWIEDDLAPVVDHVLGVFGPMRVLFGSDWPVVTLAASYERWHDAASRLVGRLPASDRDAIFGGNAARLYLSRRGRRQ